MKKIVSLVLALVLVLAIAAPAMAITGFDKPTAPTQTPVAPYGGGISLVAAPQGNTLGILSLSSPATNKAYVANEVVFFRVDLTIPKKDDITMAGYDYYKAGLTISSTAATLLDMEGYSISRGSINEGLSGIVGIVGNDGKIESLSPKYGPAALSTKTNTIYANLPDPGAVAQECVYIGTGIVKAQGEITATIMGGNMEKFKPLVATTSTPAAKLSGEAYPINDNLGNTLYWVQASGNDVVVTAYDALGAAHYFKFQRTAEIGYNGGFVTGIQYNNRGAGAGPAAWNQVYYKTLAQGGVDTFTVAGITNAKELANIKTVFDNMFSSFNFTWDATGLLLDGHFTQKLNSFYATDSVTVNLYTQAITVPDPDVEIPQTGDAATTIGFVMVAMAIVAAAAVAYKKVRA